MRDQIERVAVTYAQLWLRAVNKTRDGTSVMHYW